MLTTVNNRYGVHMYGKLFVAMYDGTLATRGPWEALITFQQFIVLADSTGVVDMTPDAIARRTTIPLDIIRKGIMALEQPDPDSRSPELEGRRIVRLSDSREWGWQIVNYAQYRNMRSQEERREYMRLYQRARRAAVNNVNDANNPLAMSTNSSKQYAVRRKERTVSAPINGTRLPDNWRIPEDWIALARAVHPDWTDQGIFRESLSFRDYWVARTGKGSTKRNWLATWRSWIRRAEQEPKR